MDPKLYIYTYQAGDRIYKVAINAYDDEEAISLRDKLLSFYANDAARLQEWLQQERIQSDWDYEQSRREARIQEVQTYRARQNSLKLIRQRILVGEERRLDEYGRRGSLRLQGLTVFAEGEEKRRDEFNLQLEDFDPLSNYTQKVSQQIEKVATESPQLIKDIEAYVAAFNDEAGASEDPLYLESLRLRLDREYFGEKSEPGSPDLSYLDKEYSNKFHSVARRIENAKIDRPNDNIFEVPDTTWQMTPLMFVVSRMRSPGLSINVRDKQPIERTGYLLQQGHDINAKDAYGRTALMYVAVGYRYFRLGTPRPGREALTLLLLEKGADPSVQDHLGKTALDYFIAEVGADHPATKLIRVALAARSMATLSVSSCVPESSANRDSIAAGGNRVFFSSTPVSSVNQSTVLPSSPKVETAVAPSSPQRGTR